MVSFFLYWHTHHTPSSYIYLWLKCWATWTYWLIFLYMHIILQCSFGVKRGKNKKEPSSRTHPIWHRFSRKLQKSQQCSFGVKVDKCPMEKNREYRNGPTQVWTTDFRHSCRGNSTEKGKPFQETMLNNWQCTKMNFDSSLAWPLKTNPKWVIATL